MKMIRPPFVVVLLLSALLFVSCEKLDVPKDTPACIKAKIRAEDKPLSISRWNVDGKTYYAIRPDCCDAFNEIWDEQCNYICAPSGGITGQGDGNCPAWSEVGVYTLIWERN